MHTHTRVQIHIYIYMYICTQKRVCACTRIFKKTNGGRVGVGGNAATTTCRDCGARALHTCFLHAGTRHDHHDASTSRRGVLFLNADDRPSPFRTPAKYTERLCRRATATTAEGRRCAPLECGWCSVCARALATRITYL